MTALHSTIDNVIEIKLQMISHNLVANVTKAYKYAIQNMINRDTHLSNNLGGWRIHNSRVYDIWLSPSLVTFIENLIQS